MTSRLLALLIAGVVSLPAVPASAQEPPVCADGWADLEFTEDFVPEGVAIPTARGGWAAGGRVTAGGRRQAAVMRFDGDAWLTVPSPPGGQAHDDSNFTGLDARAGTVWAVGYGRGPGGLVPIAARRTDRWRWVSIPPPARGGASLADIDTDARRGIWAVGVRLRRPGEYAPWVLRRAGGTWRDESPRLGRDGRGALSAVSATRGGGIWVGGYLLEASKMRPYLARRVGDGWERVALPGVREGVISDLVVTSDRDGWAVGHQLVAGRLEPLVLRRTEAGWRQARTPSLGLALLNGVATSDGDPTLVGATWDADAERFRALAARRAAGWTVATLDGVETESVHLAVDGDPTAGGRIAGRTMDLGMFATLCEPAEARSPVSRKVRRATRRAATAARRARANELPSRPRRTASAEAEGRSVRSITVTSDASFVDVAADVGLPTPSFTWSSVVSDLDADGDDDIVLGRHGERPLLLLWDGTRFVDTGVNLGRVDRHGCDAADVDRSGLPDLFCSVGAARGTGIKANELWLDPAGPAPRMHPVAGGALEPYGRGRLARFFDADQDGDPDLFVGQEPFRGDGLPSLNRLYRWVGRADLRSRPLAGVPAALQVSNVDLGDVDRDGRTDLLLVHEDIYAASPHMGVGLYRNLGGRFRDVTAAYRIRSIGETDAELVDLDGDGRLDLVQLSWTRIRVSRQAGGRFRTVWEGSFGGGGIPSDLAAGDIDGDGDRDLYILRQKRQEGHHDLILLNEGDGREFVAVAAPAAFGGLADDVLTLDHDGDGATDFLALNGLDTERGPIQLITREDP